MLRAPLVLIALMVGCSGAPASQPEPQRPVEAELPGVVAPVPTRSQQPGLRADPFGPAPGQLMRRRGISARKPVTLLVTSSSFAAGAGIPKLHTCEGQDAAPQISWTGAPEKTASFVLIVDDPDAPDPAAPKLTWVHWVLYDLPASIGELPASVRADALPSGTRQGNNNWNKTGYGGPCPPIGVHRYFHKVYALDVQLGDRGALTKDQVVEAMKGHVLAKGELIGTYIKEGS
ncbi:MAG: Raf kinase inhibitor-like YbhB/YbcL family protein [Kiritimatiellia bacterium]|jgi:Raf kinase inhibitor-like YbhB/YbcL family protein